MLSSFLLLLTRVESAHSSLKAWLGSSTGGFDTVWSQIHSQIESQINEIYAEFAKSSRIRKHVISYRCFQALNGVVTHEALNLMDQKRKVGMTAGVWEDPSTCTCYLRNTHGLPCAHEIAEKERKQELFFSSDIHVFWRTLSTEMPSAADTVADQQIEIRGMIDGYVKELYTRPMIEQKHMSNIMFSHLYPEAAHLDEPSVQQPRGRPKNNPTARNPSAWEYTFSKFSIGKSSSGSDKGRGRSLTGSRGRGRSSSGSVGRDSVGKGRASSSSSGRRQSSTAAPVQMSKPPPDFQFILPQFLIPHIMSYVDVIGDGNCGYRCVAQVIYGDENQWLDVRRELHNHLWGRWALYVRVFGEKDAGDRYASRVLASICHFVNEGAPHNRWMTLSDMGLIIATHYSAIVLELSRNQCMTHLLLL